MNTSCGSHVVSDPASGCESKGYHQNTKSKKKRYISNTSIDLKRLWKCLGLEIQNDPRSACVCVCVRVFARTSRAEPAYRGRQFGHTKRWSIEWQHHRTSRSENGATVLHHQDHQVIWSGHQVIWIWPSQVIGIW